MQNNIKIIYYSLWDYTNIVMNFLSGSSEVDGSKSFAWLQSFDVVITGSAKPGFFHEKNHANLFGVVPETEMLLNTDNGSPMSQLEKEVQLLWESRDTRKLVYEIAAAVQNRPVVLAVRKDRRKIKWPCPKLQWSYIINIEKPIKTEKENGHLNQQKDFRSVSELIESLHGFIIVVFQVIPVSCKRIKANKSMVQIFE
ncbi:hypothetical protein Ahy_B03g062411 isoform A [Arachis hypogaea]|uniref:Uncharacterized protein n=1 Tax=Arachis hypogaea TaxID=3818 RepID=A0A444ZU55_ARAHY|nr:hypothetical protein Ahy_B03g062411 isoform A [Arachis hypogaea]